MVVLVLAWTEDLVAGSDLVGMQHPFAVVAQCRRSARHPPERLHITHFEVRAVDSGDAMRTRSDEDGHECVMVGVADVVALGLLADD